MTAQLILAECAARGCNYHDLADYAAIQINDTHPSMVIPELIRLLGERGIESEEAVDIATKTCAYTNHTILAEALEKWPRAYLDAVVLQLMPIIEKLLHVLCGSFLFGVGFALWVHHFKFFQNAIPTSIKGQSGGLIIRRKSPAMHFAPLAQAAVIFALFVGMPHHFSCHLDFLLSFKHSNQA